MEGITKRFPGVTANDDVDFTLARGEIHALLGENGAGKTTLMNILYGLYSADGGKITVRGKQVRVNSPKDAIGLGIAMVHQQFELVDTLTVAENVALGLKSRRPPLLDLEEVSKGVAALSQKYGLRVSPSALVAQLSVGERQRVEIVKALYRSAEILIMDEPTSVLTPDETDDMFVLLKSMAREGKSIVMITHKLPEVMAVSDRVTVMRKGKVVGEFTTKETNQEELAVMMVGREVTLGAEGSEKLAGKMVLELKDVYASGERGTRGLKGLSLSLNSGEILGIAGVAGNGQTEIAELLAGLLKAKGGTVVVNGDDMSHADPDALIRAGVGVIPEDRKGSGLVMEFSIADNLLLEMRSVSPYSNRSILNQKEIRSRAESLAKEFSITTPDVSLPAYTLSGGNLQRLLLAKILSRRPKVLVACQPTAGLDVGATQFIWSVLRNQRSEGVGILLISSDLAEIVSLSDRVACLYEGSIVGTLESEGASIDKIGLMIGGVKAV